MRSRGTGNVGRVAGKVTGIDKRHCCKNRAMSRRLNSVVSYGIEDEVDCPGLSSGGKVGEEFGLWRRRLQLALLG